MDSRDLNYGIYFTEGEARVSQIEDYTSHNTQRLSAGEVEAMLRDLPEMKQALAGTGHA